MRVRSFIALVLVVALALGVAAGCTKTEAPKPAAEKPVTKIVVGFVPSQNADKLAATAKPLGEMLQKQLGEGYKVETVVMANFNGLVEAMGSKKVDVGFLNPFGYVLAHDLNGSKVILKTLRFDAVKKKMMDSYRAQFVKKADSPIAKIEDLKGKKVGFVDPASTSGYLYPAALLKEKGIDPEKDIKGQFLGGHDTVIKAVAKGDVDAGVSYEDARTRVAKEDKEIMKKVVPFAYTDWIPNDTVSVRKDLDDLLAKKIYVAFMIIQQTDAGKKVLKSIYDIDGLTEAKDSDYDIVRRVQKLMNYQLK